MTAPYYLNVSPTAGTTITVTEPVSVGIYCDRPIALVTVTAFYDSMRTAETVWVGSVDIAGTVTGTFFGVYTTGCTAVASLDGLNKGVRISVLRSPVWPVSPTLMITAVSDQGDRAADTLAWTLAAAPLAPAAPPVLVPNYPVGPGPGPNSCDGTLHDADYYLAMFDRIFPELSYLSSMKASPTGGYELFRGNAAVGARQSLAIERLECDALIIFANAGAYATGFVTFYRTSAAAGSIVIQRGTVVTTSNGGRDFVTTADATLSALEVTVPVQAVAQGYEWNVPGEVVTPRGETLPGSIDTVKLLYSNPPYGDPSILVRQVLNTTGGAAPALEGLGNDRGLPRQALEGEASYRQRIRTLVDTVSPGAVVRAAHRVLDPVGVAFDFIETGDIRYQTCWDAPSPNVGTPTYQSPMPANPDYDSNLFVFDDPRPEYPFVNRWLDDVEMRGAFIILVKPSSYILDTGMAYDDIGVQPSDFIKPDGRRRGDSAWDIPFPADTTVIAYGAFDGSDVGAASVYEALWATLQKIKAGGVAAIIELWHPT